MSIVVNNLTVGQDLSGAGTNIPARAATTVAGTLSTSFANGSVIDSVTLATDDIILIKDQSSGIENGLYIVQETGAPARAISFETGDSVKGVEIFIEEGTINIGTKWMCVNGDGSDIVGTNAISFTQVSSNIINATKIQDTDVADTAPTDGDNLTFNVNNNRWEPTAAFDRKNNALFWDDFVGGSISNVWVTTISNNGTVGIIDGIGGQCRLTTGTTSSGYSQLETSKKIVQISVNPSIEYRIKLSAITNITTRVGLYVDDNNLIDFYYDADGTGSTWYGRSITGGTATTTDTTVSADTNWHLFEIKGTSSNVKFYIDDVLKATITTNLYTSLVKMYIKHTTKNTTNTNILCDYINLTCGRENAGGGGCVIL